MLLLLLLLSVVVCCWRLIAAGCLLVSRASSCVEGSLKGLIRPTRLYEGLIRVFKMKVSLGPLSGSLKGLIRPTRHYEGLIRAIAVAVAAEFLFLSFSDSGLIRAWECCYC